MDKIKLEARRKARIEQKELAKIETQKKQKPVKSLIITIEWHKSKMWGNNPSGSVQVAFKDGTYICQNGYTCSGYGYDKESTVIADIFNDFLRYKLYQKHIWKDSINREKTNFPYGVYYYNGETGEVYESGYIQKPSFNGGVGTSCYSSISKFIEGKFESVATGKTFDVFKYTDNA